MRPPFLRTPLPSPTPFTRDSPSELSIGAVRRRSRVGTPGPYGRAAPSGSQAVALQARRPQGRLDLKRAFRFAPGSATGVGSGRRASSGPWWQCRFFSDGCATLRCRPRMPILQPCSSSLRQRPPRSATPSTNRRAFDGDRATPIISRRHRRSAGMGNSFARSPAGGCPSRICSFERLARVGLRVRPSREAEL